MAISNPLLNNGAQQTSNPTGYFNNVFQAVSSIFMLVGLIYFMWHALMGAFHMISSQGDPKKFEEARHSLIYSLLGLAIVFSIFAILKIVGSVFGISGLDSLRLSWPTL